MSEDFSGSVALLERPVPKESTTESPAPAEGRGRRLLRRAASEACLSFLLSLSIFITVGVLLDFVLLSFGGDEASRLADGFYVLYAYDPHLASIGFIWNPLTSVASLPFLLFWPFWHALASHCFAASLASAFAMAGAVHQLRATLAELGVARAPRLVLTALFVLNPMILYYGGNGMSEALYLFTMLLTARYLLRWLRDGRVRWLVLSGVALGFAYLARNEAAGAGIFGAAVVATVSFSRAGGVLRSRLATAVSDTAIFILPFITSFAGWAIASFVIIGQPFPQFTSQYGTSAQMRVAPGTSLGNTYLARVIVEIHAVLAFAPLLPLVLIVGVLLARRHRDARVLAPLAIVGGGLAFDFFGILTNHIGWAMRYLITAAPLGVLLAGSMLSGLSMPLRRTTAGDPRAGRYADAAIARRRGGALVKRIWITSVSMVLAFALGFPGIILTATAMWSNPTLASGQSIDFVKELYSNYQAPPGQFAIVNAIDGYLEKLNLPSGSVVMDTFDACAPSLVLDASDPTIFMVTAARAFKKTVADPILFHAKYMLVAPDKGLWTLDAINISHPTLYNSGGGFARLVRTFYFQNNDNCPPFRLYRVLRPTTSIGA